MEKLAVLGSSNLNFRFQGKQQKFCVKKMKDKSVTFCFIKFDAKVSLKSKDKGDFSVQKLGLFLQI